MSGAWVFVCGPSGAGKDSVIASARQALDACADIVFARRMITRAAQAGSDHDAVPDAEFAFLRECNALAWHWEAHGFGYGVPARYAHQVAWGRVVVVNGSRAHADGIPPSPHIHRVLVTAPLSQLVERLHRRGREEPEAVGQRLARNAMVAGYTADLVIENDGALATAGATLRNYLEALALAARMECNAAAA